MYFIISDNTNMLYIYKIKSRHLKYKVPIRNYDKRSNDTFDVCTILEKCSIDEISKYLLKEGKKRSFPDITTRQ